MFYLQSRRYREISGLLHRAAHAGWPKRHLSRLGRVRGHRGNPRMRRHHLGQGRDARRERQHVREGVEGDADVLVPADADVGVRVGEAELAADEVLLRVTPREGVQGQRQTSFAGEAQQRTLPASLASRRLNFVMSFSVCAARASGVSVGLKSGP